MATVKIWHYRGGAGEGNPTPMAQEPPVSRQQVNTTSGAAATTASPAGTYLARLECTVGTRYRVRLPGDTSDADQNDPLLQTADQSASWNWIHLPPGATISLVEAV